MKDKKIREKIGKLGTKIIHCKEKCNGVINDQEHGYYPRAFFLEPENAFQIEVVIFGKNPGKSSTLEREFYKALGERNDEKIATFKDCLRVWKAIAFDANYYERPRHLLKQLGINRNGIIWAEIVFCEKDQKIPDKTFEKCSKLFMNKILKLIPKGKHIFCLGDTAFKYVKRYVENYGNKWKIVGIYHPTGSRVFANYFEKGKKGAKLTNRKVKREFFEKLKQYGREETYLIKVRWNNRLGKLNIKEK